VPALATCSTSRRSAGFRIGRGITVRFAARMGKAADRSSAAFAPPVRPEGEPALRRIRFPHIPLAFARATAAEAPQDLHPPRPAIRFLAAPSTRSGAKFLNVLRFLARSSLT
jgi:hypothetical protein